MRRHTSPSYNERADTIVSSRFEPSLNSAMSRLPFSSLSIIRKIFCTRFSGVSSSSGSLTMLPTWIDNQWTPCWSSKRLTYHLVDCFNDLEHLIVSDLAVAINIIQLESPIKLVFHLASASDTE